MNKRPAKASSKAAFDETEVRESLPRHEAGFPLVPASAGLDPTFLAMIHGIMVHCLALPKHADSEWSNEVADQLDLYLHRTRRMRKAWLRQQVKVLIKYAEQVKWREQWIVMVRQLKAHLYDDPGQKYQRRSRSK